MQVNYNISAMIANNALTSNDNKLAESIERLSSGLKIANAKDNPSGLAISRRMNAQIKSLGVAGGNSGDGISVIQTADGTLSEVHDILQRMSELAIQAANGTNSDDDRKNIQDEIAQLKDEITRISEATQFNGQTLLDGTFDLRGYATVNGKTDPKITVNSYSDSIQGGDYYLGGLYTSYDDTTGKVTLYANETDRDNQENALDQGTIDVFRVNQNQGKITTETYMSQANVTVDGDIVRVAVNDGREIELKINENLNGQQIALELTAKGAMTMQIGANEGQTLDIRMPKVTLSNLGIFYTDVTLYRTNAEMDQQIDLEIAEFMASDFDPDNNPGVSWEQTLEEARLAYEDDPENEEKYRTYKYLETRVEEKQEEIRKEVYKTRNAGADQAIEDIGHAIQKISDIRSRLGAYQNRLEHTVSNINVTSENMTAAYSRIMDVDMAEEMTVYSTQQVLSQAGTSMLAQANERPSQVLQLLQ